MRLAAKVSLIIALFCIACAAVAQMSAPSGPFEGFKSADDEPISVTCDRMELDMASNDLTFKGHVAAKQGKRTIFADKMNARFTPEGKTVYMIATGNVKVVMGDSFAACGKLVLDNVKRVIHLTDNPRVVYGKQIITGEKMTYHIDADRFVVDKPRIEWTPDKETLPAGGGQKDNADKPANKPAGEGG